MSSPLDSLELRLREVEDRVSGGRAVTTTDPKWTPICDNLIQIEAKLKELTAGKERFNNCFQSCRQLDKYLDPEYIDRIVATDSVKFETILSFEELIRSEAKSLERVDQLSKNLDSSHLRDFDKLYPKLNEIRLTSLVQSQESAKIDEKTRILILSYNKWLENVKIQLKEWDRVLTQLENEKKSKKKSNY